jgi:hypothetical protein
MHLAAIIPVADSDGRGPSGQFRLVYVAPFAPFIALKRDGLLLDEIRG